MAKSRTMTGGLRWMILMSPSVVMVAVWAGEGHGQGGLAGGGDRWPAAVWANGVRAASGRDRGGAAGDRRGQRWAPEAAGGGVARPRLKGYFAAWDRGSRGGEKRRRRRGAGLAGAETGPATIRGAVMMGGACPARAGRWRRRLGGRFASASRARVGDILRAFHHARMREADETLRRRRRRLLRDRRGRRGRRGHGLGLGGGGDGADGGAPAPPQRQDRIPAPEPPA